MDRIALLQHAYTQSMRLIELGASYSPIIPKSQGWHTTIIDHATQAELKQKYQAETADKIEPVDYVWQGESLDTLIPEALHGQFDGLIASHVGEHIPDLIGFFKSIDRLLKPTGIITLALPDKRACFDFFQPLSTTGDVLDAQNRTRHRRSKLFDVAAYSVSRGGTGGWLFGAPPLPETAFTLNHTLDAAYAAFQSAETQPTYNDTHGWQVTVSSFQLIMLELHQLGLIPWTISRIEPAAGVEFYVWLERRSIRLNADDLQSKRLHLLQQIALETASEQLAQLVPPIDQRSSQPPAAIAHAAAPTKTISAIIPLYNGSRFIERSLDSVISQSLQPLEIIVVDDGSTDDGADVVRRYQREHAAFNIILLEKGNGGQSSARNFGANAAKGDLLAFLDQDDLWYETHLERLLRPFLRPPAGQPLGWVYSNLDEADVLGRVIHHSWLTKMNPAPEHPKRTLYNCINRDMFVLPSAALISAAVFKQVGGYDERLSGYEDDDLFLRIFHAGFQNVFLDIPLSKWCIHHQSSSYTPRMRRSRVIYSHKLLEQFHDDPTRGVFFTRDLILPRFYPHAIIEFRNALESGDIITIAETLSEMQYLLTAASLGNGINGIMTQAQAVRMNRLFRRLTPTTALRLHRLRRRLGNSRNGKLMRRLLPLY